MKNVNISSDSSSTSEFWCIQDVSRDFDDIDQLSTQNTTQIDDTLSTKDDEHELYVKGCVAVWTKGVFYEQSSQRSMPTMCFTCQSPIRFAFFCPSSLFTCPNPDKRKADQQHRLGNLYANRSKTETFNFGICLIDAETLRIYSPCGEDYRTSFPFPVSNVFQTKYGLILEKNASSAVVNDMHSLAMPRVYSLSHPLNDICPILLKAMNGQIGFVTDGRIKIAFTVFENDLVMVYDGKIGKHILCKLRKATQEEKQRVGIPDDNDIFSSEFNMSNIDLHSNSSVRFDGSGLSFKQKNLSIRNRSNIGDVSSLHGSKLFNVTPNARDSFRSRAGGSLE